MKTRVLVIVAVLSVLVAGCGGAGNRATTDSTAASPTSPDTGPLTADRARASAKEAYVYGFPMVDSYRIQNSYFINTASPE